MVNSALANIVNFFKVWFNKTGRIAVFAGLIKQFCGYRKCRTHARVFYPTLPNLNTKIDKCNRNKGRRYEENNEY